MASKWINTKLFENYVAEKQTETVPQNTLNRKDFVWASPKAGTSEKAMVYEGRFIPDGKGIFTKKYMYHMWKSGDRWVFYMCSKTHGMDKFCPVCSIVSGLYTGTTDDKALAFRMKRKERHVGNFYVADDPRDKDIDDAAKKASGKVKLYEFPGKLESKLKNEILDKKEGLGLAIFDPGSEGHNIIIKIKSTKPDGKGNTYPDYSDSIFSRKSSAIANSDNEIKTIMESTYAIDDYIKSMEMSKDDTIKMLKNEMLWSMIETDWNRNFGVVKAENAVATQAPAENQEDVPVDVGEPKASEELTDDDLLNELRSLK